MHHATRKGIIYAATLLLCQYTVLYYYSTVPTPSNISVNGLETVWAAPARAGSNGVLRVAGVGQSCSGDPGLDPRNHPPAP